MRHVLAFLAVLLLPSLARAAEAKPDEDDPNDDVRPVQ
jgi:hypothetical protein